MNDEHFTGEEKAQLSALDIMVVRGINIATFVHQMGDTRIIHLVNKRSNIL